jgi:hypothetical protein
MSEPYPVLHTSRTVALIVLYFRVIQINVDIQTFAADIIAKNVLN